MLILKQLLHVELANSIHCLIFTVKINYSISLVLSLSFPTHPLSPPTPFPLSLPALSSFLPSLPLPSLSKGPVRFDQDGTRIVTAFEIKQYQLDSDECTDMTLCHVTIGAVSITNDSFRYIGNSNIDTVWPGRIIIIIIIIIIMIEKLLIVKWKLSHNNHKSLLTNNASTCHVKLLL